MMPEKIIRNSAQCLVCLDEIESTHVHHWVACKCGCIFVDGGKDYLRRGYDHADSFKDTSIVENV